MRTSQAYVQAAQKPAGAREGRQKASRQTDGQTDREKGKGGMRASNNIHRSKVLKIVVSLFQKSRF